MAKTSVINCSVTVNGDGLSNASYSPPGFPITNTTAPSGVPAPPVNLVTGNNAIAVPPGTRTIQISPPTNSTNAKVLKGVTGDTGFAIDPATPGLYPVPSGTTAIIIGSAGPEQIAISFQ